MTEEVPGESSKERGVRKALTGDKSEFGDGVIIPLVYFTKHLDDDQARRIKSVSFWFKLGKPPVASLAGKYDRSLGEAVQYFKAIHHTSSSSDAEKLSRMIKLCLNGASDHLYGLQIPSSFPPDLKGKMEELRDKALKMGHGHSQTIWTIDDFDRLWDLTKEIALDIDRQVLGIDDADEGEYD
jgi:hypothetical protein